MGLLSLGYERVRGSRERKLDFSWLNRFPSILVGGIERGSTEEEVKESFSTFRKVVETSTFPNVKKYLVASPLLDSSSTKRFLNFWVRSHGLGLVIGGFVNFDFSSRSISGRGIAPVKLLLGQERVRERSPCGAFPCELLTVLGSQPGFTSTCSRMLYWVQTAIQERGRCAR